MTNVRIEIEDHYEVQEIPYGKDYKWVPSHALIECDCGRAMDIDIHHTVCPGCEADHTTAVRTLPGGTSLMRLSIPEIPIIKPG